MFYTVIGRIPFDDEDSLYTFETASDLEARRRFKDAILEDGEATEVEDGEPVVYVNWIISSETEPKIYYG